MKVATLTLLLGMLAAPVLAQTVPPKPQYAIVLKLVPRLLGDDPAVWTAADEQLVSAHFARLQALRQAGIVVLAGRTLNTDASQFGLVIVEVASEAEARAIMDDDPAVRGGVMTARLFPYQVALERVRR